LAKTANDWGAFESLSDTDTLSIIASSQGVGGAGKTHFWLTAPDPIAYFLFDPGGLKGLKSNPLFKEKDIRVIDFSKKLDYGRIPKGERVARAIEVMQEFDEAWPVALQMARTAVIDKEDVLWETLRYAYDEVDSPEPKNFYELNMQYKGLIVQAENAGMNLGLIRGMKDTWGKTGVSAKTGKPQMGFTGEMKPRGQKEVTELVQVNLEHRWDDDDREFKVKILEKCRLGNAVELMGQEYPNLDFLTLAMFLYPESEPSDWGL
jgi:hypothetical protein